MCSLFGTHTHTHTHTHTYSASSPPPPQARMPSLWCSVVSSERGLHIVTVLTLAGRGSPWRQGAWLSAGTTRLLMLPVAVMSLQNTALVATILRAQMMRHKHIKRGATMRYERLLFSSEVVTTSKKSLLNVFEFSGVKLEDCLHSSCTVPLPLTPPSPNGQMG